MKKVAFLNSAIITNDGVFKLQGISLKEVKDLIRGNEVLSAIGHESTAQILSDLLEIEVPVSRIKFVQEVGQKAIVFKMRERIPAGKILSKTEIQEIGFDFKVMERTA